MPMEKRRLQQWAGPLYVRNRADAVASIDLFVVPTISFRLLYGFLALRHSRREILWLGLTAHPSAEWICPSTNRSLRLVRTATNLALKEAPIPRDVQRAGPVPSLPILGGLHHRHVRVCVFDKFPTGGRSRATTKNAATKPAKDPTQVRSLENWLAAVAKAFYPTHPPHRQIHRRRMGANGFQSVNTYQRRTTWHTCSSQHRRCCRSWCKRP
jgi:hypothetical protein